MATRNHESNDSIAARLREAMEHRKVNNTQLAEAIDTRKGTVGDWLAGKSLPGTDNLREIFRFLKVLPTWLMLGIGPKYYEDSGTDFTPVTPGVDQWLAEHPELSDDERTWLRSLPWPSQYVRQSDITYLTALATFRQTRP